MQRGVIDKPSIDRIPERYPERYYLSKDGKIFSDKLSKFVVRCNERSSGLVFNRISNIYSHIFIDEAQDLAGYDLDILKLLFNSPIRVVLVGDPRQVVYITHNENRYKKYAWGKIRKFIDEECDISRIEIDEESYCHSYRCHSLICQLADDLYPELKKTVSMQNDATGHDGIFLVERTNIDAYCRKFKPTQLRYNSRTPVCCDDSSFTFGKSKGLTFDRVLIYPTKDMEKWINDRQQELEITTRAKFYVALTRAKHSAALCVSRIKEIPDGVTVWP